MRQLIEPLPNAMSHGASDQTRSPLPWPRIVRLLAGWLVASVLTTVGAIIYYPVVASSVFFVVAYGSLTASPDDLPAWGWAIVFGLLAAPLVLIGASLTGLVQVVVMGRLVPRPLGWWGATVAGAAVAGLLAAGPALAMLLMLAVARGHGVLEGRGDLALYHLVVGAGVGIAQGVAQGVVLGRRVAGRWWMIASGGATIAAWLVIAGAAWQRTQPEFLRIALLVAVAAGLVYGLLSGPALLWLLRDRLPPDAAAAEDMADDAATQARRTTAAAEIAARRARPGRSWLQRWLD
jgi:hypothetical protein